MAATLEPRESPGSKRVYGKVEKIFAVSLAEYPATGHIDSTNGAVLFSPGGQRVLLSFARMFGWSLARVLRGWSLDRATREARKR